MTDQTTETRVAEIEKRAEKASPAPWRAMAEGNQYLDGVTRETLVGASRVDGLVRPWNKRGAAHYFEPEMESTARFKDDDASFIAYARTDIPWLTAQLRAAWKREAALREALANLRGLCRPYGGKIWGPDWKAECSARGTTIDEAVRRIDAALQETPDER